MGVPILSMELAIGRGSKKSTVRAYGELEKKGQKWHIHGYVALIGNYLLMMFYTVVAGWMLYYFYSFLYDPYTSLLTLDRSCAGSRADIVHTRSCKVRSQNGALKLRILLDKNSVEVFANDGEQTMTAWILHPAIRRWHHLCCRRSGNHYCGTV